MQLNGLRVWGFQRQEDGATAYADNWTCWRRADQSTDQMIQHTLNTTKAFGLQIDWEKTWVWSTKPDGHNNLEAAIAEHIPDAKPTVKSCAKDLGCHVTYHGNPRLGSIHERIQKAKDRLDRIRQKPWDHLLKIHIILTSVLPVVFYGAELIYLGEHHLDSLRTNLANAIVGEKIRSMNPALFLHCATTRPLDPLLVLILQAIKAAMKFLRHARAEERSWFMQILSKPLKNTHAVWGPASALREYLLKLGWTCCKSGYIQVTNNRKLNLQTTSFAVIRKYAEIAWKEHLLLFLTDRHRLFNRRPIDNFGTEIALKKFPIKHQLLILREIASAFQTKAQQSTWDQQTSSTCDWCGTHQDSRYHRLVECEAFVEAREPHTKAIQYLQEEGLELCDLPVIHQHPHAEYRQIILDALPEPTIDENTVTSLQCGRDMDSLHFYTDGSCRHPTCKHLCFASYSIVVDVLRHDVDRRVLAAAFPYTQSLASFQPIACGRLNGFQSIHRAELVAVVILCEYFTEFTAFTDSADVIHKVALCRRTTEVKELAGFADFDLLIRLHATLTPEKQILKTKAHREIAEIQDLNERYQAMGNAAVDFHAKQTCEKFLPEIFHELEMQYVDTKSDIDKLQDVFALILDLQVARAQAEEDQRVGQHIGDETGGVFPKQPESTSINWSIANKWTLEDQWNTHWIQFSAWGPQVMQAVASWLTSCEWPVEEETSEEDIGISWAEVAIALALHHGQWPPVRRERRGLQYVVQATTDMELEMIDTNLAEQAKMAYSVVQHFWTLIPQHVMPEHVSIGKVKALYVQGFGNWSTGIRRRPYYPKQSEVFFLLATFLQRSERTLQGLPQVGWETFHQWDSELAIKEKDWKEREKIAKKAQLEVRRQRQ